MGFFLGSIFRGNLIFNSLCFIFNLPTLTGLPIRIIQSVKGTIESCGNNFGVFEIILPSLLDSVLHGGFRRKWRSSQSYSIGKTLLTRHYGI
jgi:hypothetical protein